MNAVKVLVDMNLSPDWVEYLTSHDFEAIHWSTVGRITEVDSEIMEWARRRKFVVFTHDLDYGTMLALTRAQGPSVIQVRTQDITLAAIGKDVIDSLRRFRMELERGALVVIEEARSRVRVLPLHPFKSG